MFDIAGGTAGTGSSLPLGDAKTPARRLASALFSGTREVQGAVAAPNDPTGVFQHCRAIKANEETGDAIWEEGLTALFAGTSNPIEVLVWKEMYDLLEQGLDACDHVANVLESISVRHA